VSDIDFGDYDVADAWDNEPADGLQIGIRLHLIRQRLERLSGRDLPEYWDLGAGDQGDLRYIGERIADWTLTHSPIDRHELAEQIVDIAEGRRGSDTGWEDLSLEEQHLAIAVADLIADWLIRQGAWQ